MLKIASQSQFRRARSLRGGIVIGLALALVGAGVGTATGAVTTPFQLVLVKNTATEPIPVVGTVNVGNTPANQNVTVSNFPATQPVSGTVSVSNKVTRFFTVEIDVANGETRSYAIPNSIDASALTLHTASNDSMNVALTTTTGAKLRIHSGEGFSRDFTLPVPITSVEITCTNYVLYCLGFLSVWGN